MIAFSTNPNVVYVSTIQSKCHVSARQDARLLNYLEGCCETEFDSTYPVHLHGIISENEFRESIQNINRTVSPKRSLMLCAVMSTLCLAIGFILFIGGGVTVGVSGSTKFFFLIGVGFALFLAGMILFMVSCCVVRARMLNRLQEAIAHESATYSRRSPRPCSWRLNTTTITAGYHHNRRTHVSYQVVSRFVSVLSSDSTRSSLTSAMLLSRCMMMCHSHRHTVKQLEDSVLDVAYHGSIRALKLAHPVPSRIINSENLILSIVYDSVASAQSLSHFTYIPASTVIGLTRANIERFILSSATMQWLPLLEFDVRLRSRDHECAFSLYLDHFRERVEHCFFQRSGTMAPSPSSTLKQQLDVQR